MALEGPRVLAQVLTGTDVTTGPEGAIITAIGPWGVVDGTANAAVQRDYFDLSGYNRDFLTTFVSGVEMQEPGPLAGSDENNQLIEIVSTEFIDDTNITNFLGGNGFNGPGFTRSTDSMDQVVYGRRRLYTFEVAIAPVIPKLWHTSTWGTCSALTSDKLHITRIIVTSTAGITFVSDLNVVLAVIVAKEDELPFLMRQKRSYELATGP